MTIYIYITKTSQNITKNLKKSLKNLKIVKKIQKVRKKLSAKKPFKVKAELSSALILSLL